MQPSKKFIAYYRVSTQRQGISGLGLEAQQAEVKRFLRGDEPIAVFEEIESGRKNHRPQLQAALELAEREGATLLIAKLDRLARSVSFISQLLDGKVPFVSCDMPEANKMMLQMSAVFAEHEARMISDRTKAALAAAKERGVKLGGAQASTLKRISDFDNSILADIQVLIENGAVGPAAIARGLNERNVRASKGGTWTSGQVVRVIHRLGLD